MRNVYIKHGLLCTLDTHQRMLQTNILKNNNAKLWTHTRKIIMRKRRWFIIIYFDPEIANTRAFVHILNNHFIIKILWWNFIFRAILRYRNRISSIFWTLKQQSIPFIYSFIIFFWKILNDSWMNTTYRHYFKINRIFWSFYMKPTKMIVHFLWSTNRQMTKMWRWTDSWWTDGLLENQHIVINNIWTR